MPVQTTNSTNPKLRGLKHRACRCARPNFCFLLTIGLEARLPVSRSVRGSLPVVRCTVEYALGLRFLPVENRSIRCFALELLTPKHVIVGLGVPPLYDLIHDLRHTLRRLAGRRSLPSLRW